MRLTDAYRELASMRGDVVTTREASARWHASPPTTTRRLRGLEQGGLVRQLRQGLWALDTEIEPFAIAPYLTAPMPAYVSLWSALSQHGVIEQIPRRTSVASLDRSQTIETSVGGFDIHQLAPEVFGGFESLPSGGYMATPAKAVFDTVYVRAASGSQAFFPELEMGERFEMDELKKWVDRIPSKRLRTIVGRHVGQALRETHPYA